MDFINWLNSEPVTPFDYWLREAALGLCLAMLGYFVFVGV